MVLVGPEQSESSHRHNFSVLVLRESERGTERKTEGEEVREKERGGRVRAREKQRWTFCLQRPHVAKTRRNFFKENDNI